MTDSIKISQLPAATTPLTGAEEVALVQGGATKQATVTDVTTVIATGSTTARSLANRAADVVNVKDFGAVGDGVTDDTAAITAANTAASAVGATLEFPAGKYLFTGSIEVERVTWRGPAISRRNVSSYLNDVGGAIILLTIASTPPHGLMPPALQ